MLCRTVYNQTKLPWPLTRLRRTKLNPQHRWPLPIEQRLIGLFHRLVRDALLRAGSSRTPQILLPVGGALERMVRRGIRLMDHACGFQFLFLEMIILGIVANHKTLWLICTCRRSQCLGRIICSPKRGRLQISQACSIFRIVQAQAHVSIRSLRI